jgi:hypothetical protein
MYIDSPMTMTNPMRPTQVIKGGQKGLLSLTSKFTFIWVPSGETWFIARDAHPAPPNPSRQRKKPAFITRLTGLVAQVTTFHIVD